jgi:hypothetical protein
LRASTLPCCKYLGVDALDRATHSTNTPAHATRGTSALTHAMEASLACFVEPPQVFH